LTVLQLPAVSDRNWRIHVSSSRRTRHAIDLNLFVIVIVHVGPAVNHLGLARLHYSPSSFSTRRLIPLVVR
jgi:hypothetical protein